MIPSERSLNGGRWEGESNRQRLRREWRQKEADLARSGYTRSAGKEVPIRYDDYDVLYD